MAARKKSSPPSRTALVVLGMHRSGTSALAGVLGHMGADLPQDLMPPSEMNAKGFFESNRITGLNEDLLASAGQRWFSYSPVSRDWFASSKATEFENRAVEDITADYGRSHLFVLKDPRICRLLPFWHRALARAGCRTMYVCTHRHPLDVAASLTRWANYEPGYGLLLWLRHMLEAEAGSRGQPRVFTSYEQLMADCVETVTTIGKGLGLKWPRNPTSVAPEIETFLSKELQHFRQSAEATRPGYSLPDWVAETYAIFESWADKGERAADYERLDCIRAGIDQSGATFASVVWSNQQQWLEVQTLTQQLDELEAASRTARQEAISHAANHATEQKWRGAVEVQRAELALALEAAQLAAAEQAMALEAAMAEAGQAARAQADSAVRMAELTAALDQTRAEVAGHQTNHAAEQKHREAVEVQRAELALALETAQLAAAEQVAALEAAETQVANQIRALATAESGYETLTQAQARLEDDLLVSQAATMTAVQEADQLRSALIQRGQETEDLHRQTLADAAHITGLQTTLADLTRDHATLTRQAARDGRHLAAMTARLTAVMHRDLERRLTGQTEQAAVARAARETEQLRHELVQREQDVAALQGQMTADAARIAGLEATLSDLTRDHTMLTQLTEQAATTRSAMSEEIDHLRGELLRSGQDAAALQRQTTTDATRIAGLETTLSDLTRDHAALIGQTAAASIVQEAEVLQQRQLADERIAALQTHVQALHNSTSWKLTSPLRRISATLRRSGT